jgi:hypothetical protein
MLIQYLLDFTYIVLEYTNTVIHTKGKKQCSGNFAPKCNHLLWQLFALEVIKALESN